VSGQTGRNARTSKRGNPLIFASFSIRYTARHPRAVCVVSQIGSRALGAADQTIRREAGV